MKKIINLTPHAINVIKGEEKIIFPPSGAIARVCTHSIEAGVINNIPIVKTSYGDIDFGVELEEDTIYIVSAIVLSALKAINHPNLNQFVAPNTGAAIRNTEGQIIGVPGFTI